MSHFKSDNDATDVSDMQSIMMNPEEFVPEEAAPASNGDCTSVFTKC